MHSLDFSGPAMYRIFLFALIILAALWAVADIDTRSHPNDGATAAMNGARGAEGA